MPRQKSFHLVEVLEPAAVSVAAAQLARQRSEQVWVETLLRRLRRNLDRAIDHEIDPATEDILREHLLHRRWQ